MKRTIAVIFSLTIAACASDGTERSQPAAEQVYGTTQSTQEPAEESESDVSAKSDEMVAQTGSGGIEALDPPEIDRLPADQIPNRPGTEDAIVCERVVPTGSVLPRKICRHQSEIDQRSATDQRTIDDIKSNTANAASRL